MAIDALLAMQMRDALGDPSGLSERRMMGAVCFLLNGNMACGADRTKAGVGRFMFRLGANRPVPAHLEGAEPMMMGERLMRGYYFVDADRCGPAQLEAWLAAALAYAGSLPPK